MSEQTDLQSMMEDVERSSDLLMNLREKTDEIKKNLLNQEMERLLKVYLMINRLIDDQEKFEAYHKFMSVAKESLPEEEGEYFEDMRYALEMNDSNYAEIAEHLPRRITIGVEEDLRIGFISKYLNNEINIPNFTQWQTAMHENLNQLLLIPGQIVGFDLEKCLTKALDRKGWIIKNISNNTDQRITQSREMGFYPIFVADRGDPLSELRVGPVEQKLEYLDDNNKRIRKDESDFRFVGLTLNEFLYNILLKLNAGIPFGNLQDAVVKGALLDERIFRSNGTDKKNPISFLSVNPNVEDNVLDVYRGALRANPRVGLKLPKIGNFSEK